MKKIIYNNYLVMKIIFTKYTYKYTILLFIKKITKFLIINKITV